MSNNELKQPRRARIMQQMIREYRREGHKEIVEEITKNLHNLTAFERIQ